MISKELAPFDSNLQYTTMLNVGSRGLDGSQLRKIAAADVFVFQPDFERRAGEAYLHVITTGAGETYGPNKNRDWWNKEAHEFRGGNGKSSMMLDGGLKKYHNTFMKYGAVYEEHVNGTKKGTPKGRIVAETFNPIMDRGELLVAVPEDGWATDLQKLATGGDVFWSLGAAVPFDYCSYCLNKAPTRKQYCEHLKYASGQIMDNGTQVFAINDHPMFHDISKVRHPADHIAFTLRKVANAGGDATALYLPRPIPLHIAQKLAGYRERKFLDILQKLAEIEKEIEVCPTDAADEMCSACKLPGDIEGELTDKLKDVPTDAIMSASKRQMLLPPKVFIQVVLHRPPEEADSAEAALPGIFQQLQQDPNLSEILDDGSYVGAGHQDSRLRDLEPLLSLNDEPVRKRILIISASGGAPRQKEATQRPQTADDAGARVLATEYAKYQLAWLASQQDYNRYASMIVATNRG